MVVPPISDEQYELMFGSLELDGAFQQLAALARADEKGNLGDYARDASQILRTRAAFAQVKAQLQILEEDFEAEANDFKQRLCTQLGALARYEERRG